MDTDPHNGYSNMMFIQRRGKRIGLEQLCMLNEFDNSTITAKQKLTKFTKSHARSRIRTGIGRGGSEKLKLLDNALDIGRNTQTRLHDGREQNCARFIIGVRCIRISHSIEEGGYVFVQLELQRCELARDSQGRVVLGELADHINQSVRIVCMGMRRTKRDAAQTSLL